MLLHKLKIHIASFLCLSLYALLHQPLLVAEPEQAKATPSQPGVYDKIVQAYLPSQTKALLAEEKAQKEISAANRIKNNDAELFNLNSPIEEVTIGSIETYRLLCGMLQAYYAKEVVPHLTDDVLANLELFCGPSKALDQHVFGTIDNTITTMGKIELQKLLITPTIDSKELQRRQKLIKQLAENPKLIKSLETSLQQIKQHEADLAWFWHQTDEFFEALLQNIYWEKTPLLNLAVFNNSIFLELKSFAITILLPIFGSVQAAQWLADGINFVNQNNLLGNALEAHEKIKKYLLILGLASIFLFAFYGLIDPALRNSKSYNNTSNAIHKKMIGVARSIQALHDIKSSVFTQKEALALIASDKKNLESMTNKDDSDKEELYQMLSTKTFKGSPALFSNKGRVLVAFKMMHEIKDRFIDVMRTVGTLDAYLSLAKLYRKGADAQHNHYCLVDYDTQETPQIAINGLWHPLNSSYENTNAINNVTLQPQATTLAIIMAHTCGIAPAQEMHITPHATFLSNLITEVVQQPAPQPSIAS